MEHPERLTARGIMSQANIEVRRVLLDLMGYERFLADAAPEVLDTDTDGGGQPSRLLRVAMGNDEPLTLVEVRCPSTGRDYHLRVPPTMERASQAVAWTFSLEVPDYAPLVEA